MPSVVSAWCYAIKPNISILSFASSVFTLLSWPDLLILEDVKPFSPFIYYHLPMDEEKNSPRRIVQVFQGIAVTPGFAAIF